MAPRPLSLAGRAGVRGACAGACLLALLAGCGGGAKPPAPGRLHGTVTRGPISPVCHKGTPCTEPAAGEKITFVRDNHLAARVVVAKDGSYSVSLAPGSYFVGVDVLAPPTVDVIAPGTVRVIASENRRRDFQIDTGIR